jgi:hypothetical protein
MKWFVYIVFAIIYLLVTFFGLGPVLMADGSDQERILTLTIVLVIYVVLAIVMRSVVKRLK